MKTKWFSCVCRYSLMTLSFLCLVTSNGFAGVADMEAKLGVLIIHGVGSQKEDFADPMIEELKGRISDQAEIQWQTVYWDPVLERQENDLLRELFPEGGSLDWFKLRALVMNYIGDVTAYRYISNDPTKKTNEVYDVIHDIVHESMVELRKKLGSTDKPLIVMAHSLGSVIMFDYIRDRQEMRNGDPYGKTRFERMETLSGFITFGSPIPLFTLAYDRVPCITLPPDNLQGALKDKARWLNFYDHDDVFGWPLKYLTDRCKGRVKACVIEDKRINVGDIYTFWDPLCHSKYWTDDNFTKPVARYISEILKACP